MCLGSVSIANILSSRFWHGPVLCRILRYILAERCTDFAPPQSFCCAATTFSLISSMRPVALPSSSFLSRKASSLSPNLSLSLSSLFFICSRFFKHIVQVGFSFYAFFAALCPRNFLSPVRQALCSPQRSLSTSLSVSHVPRRLRSFVLRCFPRVAATWFSLSRTALYFTRCACQGRGRALQVGCPEIQR